MSRRHSLSADDRPLGEYVVDFRLFDHSTHTAEPLEFSLDIRAVESLRVHLDNALDSLHERLLRDAVCGPCEECGNTRMVHPLRHGRPSAEHCPTCWPKWTAARVAMSEGRPPEAGS